MITVEPPVVQPSLGEIALMQGTADAGYSPEKYSNYYIWTYFSKGKYIVFLPISVMRHYGDDFQNLK